MAWHDMTPWSRKRQQGAVAVERISKVKEILNEYENGDRNAIEVMRRLAELTEPTPRKETRNGLAD
jgi:hypothetical protein